MCTLALFLLIKETTIIYNFRNITSFSAIITCCFSVALLGADSNKTQQTDNKTPSYTVEKRDVPCTALMKYELPKYNIKPLPAYSYSTYVKGLFIISWELQLRDSKLLDYNDELGLLKLTAKLYGYLCSDPYLFRLTSMDGNTSFALLGSAHWIPTTVFP